MSVEERIKATCERFPQWDIDRLQCWRGYGVHHFLVDGETYDHSIPFIPYQ